MDFIANATGSIFAQGWTPELQKMVGGKQDAAGLLKAVQAEYAEGARTVDHPPPMTPTRGGRSPRLARRRLDRRPSRRISWTQGIRRQTLVGWLFVLPALVMYGLFVLQPLALTVQYSLYRWDGVGPATWVGLSNYVTVLSDPKLVETLFNAFRLVVFFSLIPVALGLVTASVIHRVATGRLGDGLPDRPVPAPGHPARRGGHHLGLAAVADRARQPGPDGGRPRRRHPGLARRLRHGAAGRRAHRDLGAARASARSCC